MKPKIKTRIANLIAKLAGSDEYDPRVEPITPLEFYLDQYIKDPIPRLTITSDMFNRDATIPIELTPALYESILRTGMIRLSLLDLSAVTTEYVLPCTIGPIREGRLKNVSASYLILTDPNDPDAGYVSFGFTIFAESNGRWSFIGTYTEL